MRWRRWLGLDAQTLAEKRAASNGISLFFGALIGANLGTTAHMPISDYALIIAVMCLIVLYLYLAPVARRRWSSVANLLLLVAGLYLLLVHEIGTAAFEGTRPTAHIFVTVCFWIGSILLIELRPIDGAATDRRTEPGVDEADRSHQVISEPGTGSAPRSP